MILKQVLLLNPWQADNVYIRLLKVLQGVSFLDPYLLTTDIEIEEHEKCYKMIFE